MIQLLSADKQMTVSAAPGRPQDRLWLNREVLSELTGWQLKPEGLCKREVCTPLDPAAAETLIEGDWVHASGLWESLGRPVLCDADATTWMLGEAAADRSRELESLEAPDFTLPDIEGKLHSLSDFRGKKVFLSTWASW
jgi:hypothetical protein